MHESELLEIIGKFYADVYSQTLRFVPQIVELVESEYGTDLDTPAVRELSRRVVHAMLCSFAGELERNEFTPGALRYYIDNNGSYETELDDTVDPVVGWISMVDDREILLQHVTEPLPTNNYVQ